jgi:DcuC family C4-dicarboxylate transporter
MIYVSLLVVALTVVAIVKGFETRMVLFVSGLVLSVLALRPFAAFIAFFNMMTSTPLIPNIVSCMAFAEVMRYTGCDVHLIRALIQGLGKVYSGSRCHSANILNQHPCG